MQMLRISAVLAALAVCRAVSEDAKDLKHEEDLKDDKELQDIKESKDLKESKQTSLVKEFKPLPEGPDPRDITEDLLSDTNRTRRSGVIGLFNTKLHRKFALLGSLSSSNPHIPETGPDYGPPLSYDHKTFSLWGFKKAIFSTLLQAIKAITGGVIALKGQLIKVNGHLLAAKGHLLQTKGEAISDFGRHIATKALLSPPQVPPSATGISGIGSGVGGSGYGAVKPSYGVPSGPSYPSAPKPVYGPPPSGPSSGYGAPPAKHSPSSAYGPPPPSSPSSAYGPPPPSGPSSAYGPPPPSAPSSAYGGPSSPDSTPPSPSYGAPPPPPLPSTSYGTPVRDYNGPPPPSSSGSGSSSLFLPPSFPAGPSAPSSAYGSPFKRDIKLPEGVHAGLLVLKPLQGGSSPLDPRHAPPPYAATRLRRQPTLMVTPVRHR